MTQAGFRKCPCRASFLELPFLPCSFPFNPQPELSRYIWAFHPFSLKEMRRHKAHAVSSWAPEDPSVHMSLSQQHLVHSLQFIFFFKALAIASISCGIFSLKIPSCLLTRIKPVTVQLHLASLSTRVLLSPRKRTFWYLLSTGTKIKSSRRLEFIFIKLVYLHAGTNLWSMLVALLIYSIFQVWSFRITPSPNCSGITSGLSLKGKGYCQGKTY